MDHLQQVEVLQQSVAGEEDSGHTCQEQEAPVPAGVQQASDAAVLCACKQGGVGTAAWLTTRLLRYLGRPCRLLSCCSFLFTLLLERKPHLRTAGIPILHWFSVPEPCSPTA